MSEDVQMGIPERIIVNLRVSMDPKLAPELVKGLDAGLTREDTIKALTEWAFEFKKDLEELPGVEVTCTVEEVI